MSTSSSTIYNTKVTLHRIALHCSPRRASRSVLTNSLADLLYARFEELGQIPDLNEALDMYRETLELRSHGNPDRAHSLGNLANCLHTRAAELGTLSDLDEALTLYRERLGLLPQGHPDRALSLAGTADCLYARFTRLTVRSDLDEAISFHRDALHLRPQGHPHRILLLINAAECFYVRFSYHGVLSDLDEALALEREAFQLQPQGHPNRVRSLRNIAEYLRCRFTQLGTLSDLDEAIALERDVLKLRPKGDPDRVTSLSNIASSLHVRFVQFGTRSDLDEALVLEREASEIHPQGHPGKAISLCNLACYLNSRFTHFRTLSDLDEALALQYRALALRPQGHAYRAVSLCNVADYLHTRCKYLGAMSQLDEVLALYYDALELFPQGHSHRAVSMHNIARCLYTRSTPLGTSSDLDEAITLARDGLQLHPQGHPNRASALGILIQCLHARFKLSHTHDENDLEEMFSSHSELSDAPQAVSLADLRCAKQWIQAAEQYKHSTTVLAYQTFLRFSQHLASILSLPRDLALLRGFTELTVVDAFSACIRYGNLTYAVELFEQGRGVFWDHFFRLHSPLNEVIASGDKGKELADRFSWLTTLLRNMLNAPPTAESRYDRVCDLNLLLQKVVADIRKLHGLSDFLRPPRFSDLQIVAAAGPVIIVNASKYGCDALIVLPDRDPIHIALPITKSRVSELSSELHSMISRANCRDVTEDILVLLRELWDAVVFPIVKVLKDFCAPGSRIWWCPTVEFTRLPLHAAGLYRDGQPILSDPYVSSYTPTLTALIRARRERSLDSSIKQPPRFLFVGQAQTPGQEESTSVNTELSTVSRHMSSVTTLTCIQGEDVTIARVTEELNKNEFVHLACYGITDRNHPFKSGFTLGDGLLKVEDVMRCDLQNARFACLSACQTTVGDEESPDGVIYFATAMQMVGFQSVVGTMGTVDDAHTKKMAARVYNNMVDEFGHMDHTRAALALHESIRNTRSSDISFTQRILSVHIGA